MTRAIKKTFVFVCVVTSVVAVASSSRADENRVMVFDSVEPNQRVVSVPEMQQPVQAAPVQMAPIQVQAAPVQMAPVQMAPVQQVQQMAPVQIAAPAPVMIQQPAVFTQPVQMAPAMSRGEQAKQNRLSAEKGTEDVIAEAIEKTRLANEQRLATQMSNTAAVLQGNLQNGNSVASVQSVNASAVDGGADTLQTSQANVVSASETPSSSSRFLIIPQGGLSNISADKTYFEISPRYSAGLALGVEASQYVAVEAGWLYSEYGIKASSSNPYIMNYQYARQPYGQPYGTSGNAETLALKQNVFNIGAKVYLLNASIRIRPFLGAGLGYSRGYVNYDSQVIDYLKTTGLANMTYDYEVSQFLGQLSAGFDVRASDHLAIGLTGRYNNVMSSRENQSFNNAALGYGGAYGGYGNSYPYAGGYGLYNPDAEKSLIGGSLAKSGFWSVLASLMISF